MTSTQEGDKSPEGLDLPPQHGVPDWVPEGSSEDPRFASRVMPAASHGGGFSKHPPAKRRRLTTDDLEKGIRVGDISVLSRAITLVESNRPSDVAQAQDLLARVLPLAGNSMRVGITGVPGAGKSTMIESLGCQLCARGHRVAVLAVDPSSSVNGGSILGDKTRMQHLVREPHAFIRPSPSGGSLGGVARKSRETMLLCEAAGFDVVLVETVGVGQNEVTVRSMVDFFLLVQIAGAGDELQGMKKGVMEIADMVVVNKADGENLQRARVTVGEIQRVLPFLQPATHGWQTRALTCSALQAETLAAMWEVVIEFFEKTRESGGFARRRSRQSIEWMHALIREELMLRFRDHPQVAACLPGLESAVASMEMPVVSAVEEIMKRYEGHR